jgi:hypothetical protein
MSGKLRLVFETILLAALAVAIAAVLAACVGCVPTN